MNFFARLFFVCVLFAETSIVRAGDMLDCHIGSYRLADGSLVDIAPSDDDTLRWRQFDGATGALHKSANEIWKSTYGWTDRADGIAVSFSACRLGQISFGGASAQRITLDVKEVTFKSHGTVLVGRLVMPKGEEQVPIVVLLHGSEQASEFTLAYYPDAEHGMTLFETSADGSRISTRYASGYFRMIRDFARDVQLHGSYGDAELSTRLKGGLD
jgi:hypothetical protein